MCRIRKGPCANFIASFGPGGRQELRYGDIEADAGGRRFFGSWIPASSQTLPMYFRLGTGETLHQAFVAAGFVDIVARRLQTRLFFATADEACEAAFAGGPACLAYGRFSDSTKAEAHGEYLASLEPYRLGVGYSVPGEFVVTAGTKAASSVN
jgi:hypothetical protein